MGWSRNETVGFLVRFWSAVLETSPVGDVTKMNKNPQIVAEILGMDREVCAKALGVMLDIQFLDATDRATPTGDRAILVHDWLEYAGNYLRNSKYRRNNAMWEMASSIHRRLTVGEQTADGQPTVGKKSTVDKRRLDKTREEQKEEPTPPVGLPQEAFSAWEAWTKHRKEIRKPLTPTAIERQIKFLSKYKPAQIVEIIDYSIRNQYQGLFEPRDDGAHATKGERPIHPNTLLKLREELSAQKKANWNRYEVNGIIPPTEQEAQKLHAELSKKIREIDSALRAAPVAAKEAT